MSVVLEVCLRRLVEGLLHVRGEKWRTGSTRLGGRGREALRGVLIDDEVCVERVGALETVRCRLDCFLSIQSLLLLRVNAACTGRDLYSRPQIVVLRPRHRYER